MEAHMQIGTFYFSQYTDPGEWHLNSGIGERRFHVTIKFPEPFTTPPRVAVALTGVDASNTTNLRVFIAAQDIEAHEFDLAVNTWDNTILHGVNGVWIAE
jgi:hypothetical protein